MGKFVTWLYTNRFRAIQFLQLKTKLADVANAVRRNPCVNQMEASIKYPDTVFDFLEHFDGFGCCAV